MPSDSKWLRWGVVVAILMGIPGWITLLRPNLAPRPHPAPITESAASQSDSLMVGHNILVGLFYASPAAGALFLLVAAFVVFKNPKASPPQADIASPAEPSKLVIYSANYAASDGGGKRYEVDDFLRRITFGDSLVLDVENHNFALAHKNYVPLDPKPGSPKRLQVTYSYDDGAPQTTERPEHFRMVLPEDSYVNDAFDKLIQQVGKKDLLDDLKNIDYEAKCDALAERKQVDGLLVPLQIEALALAKELREFADELGPCPEIPNTGTLTPGTPEHDAALKGMAGAGEARERWDNNLYHGYANRDFGKKISSIFHRAGEKYSGISPRHAG